MYFMSMTQKNGSVVQFDCNDNNFLRKRLNKILQKFYQKHDGIIEVIESDKAEKELMKEVRKKAQESIKNEIEQMLILMKKQREQGNYKEYFNDVKMLDQLLDMYH